MLFVEIVLLEQREKFDYVRVLRNQMLVRNSPSSTEKRGCKNEKITFPSNSLVVPSKQRTRVLGLFSAESASQFDEEEDMMVVEGRKHRPGYYFFSKQSSQLYRRYTSGFSLKVYRAIPSLEWARKYSELKKLWGPVMG